MTKNVLERLLSIGDRSTPDVCYMYLFILMYACILYCYYQNSTEISVN